MTTPRRAWDAREHEPARIIELSQEHEIIGDRLTPGHIAKNWTRGCH
jgi:hypothetical protein